MALQMKDVEINARLAFDFWPTDAIHRNGDEIKHKNKVLTYRDPKVMQRLMYALKAFTTCCIDNSVIITTGGITAHEATLARAVAVAYLKSKETI